jgi:hypothetical protein
VLDAVPARAAGALAAYAVLADGVDGSTVQVPVLRDAAGEFRTAYRAGDGTTVLVRPDGYIGHRGATPDADAVRTCLAAVLRD